MSGPLSLLEAVAARSPLWQSAVHGRLHANRVAATGLELAARTSGADSAVVFAFGLLHDSQRQHDGADIEHPARAADFAVALASAGLLPLDQARTELLLVALREHSRPVRSNDPTVGCCLDADRLNLQRLGIAVDVGLLSTPTAAELVDWAKDRLDEYVPWEELAASAGIPIDRRAARIDLAPLYEPPPRLRTAAEVVAEARGVERVAWKYVAADFLSGASPAGLELAFQPGTTVQAPLPPGEAVPASSFHKGPGIYASTDLEWIVTHAHAIASDAGGSRRGIRILELHFSPDDVYAVEPERRGHPGRGVITLARCYVAGSIQPEDVARIRGAARRDKWSNVSVGPLSRLWRGCAAEAGFDIEPPAGGMLLGNLVRALGLTDGVTDYRLEEKP